MATLMRCTQPHWQGNTFIRAGTIRAKGHPEVIDAFFEVLEVEEPEPRPQRGKTKGAS